MSYEVRRALEIDMGHRIPFHDSQCRRPHGHRYRIEALASAPRTIDYEDRDSSSGMVVDFGDLKKAMLKVDEVFDHRFVIWEDDPLREEIIRAFDGAGDPDMGTHRISQYGCSIFVKSGVVTVPVIPTAEEMARLWFRIICSGLRGQGSEGMSVEEIRVHETPNNLAVYREG